MSTPEIREFAKLLVESVRDAAIRCNDDRLCADVTFNPIAERWREATRGGRLDTIAKVMIPDVVDSTMFYLLHAIDEKLLRLSFTASNGKKVDLVKAGLGELAGWYAGSPSWRDEFTRERFVNDHADLDCAFEDLPDLEEPPPESTP